MNLYYFLNILIFFNLFFTILFLFLTLKFPEIIWLKLLKFTFEASLVGSIADTYAIFGLFYKLGPHTNIIIGKKDVLIEKIKLFVGDFLLNKDFLEKELEKVDINLFEYVDETLFREKLSDVLMRNIKKIKIPQQILSIITKEIIDKIIQLLHKNETIKSKINYRGKKIIKNIIIENHTLLLDLIEKRLKGIDDREFVNIIKQTTWNELQWIRLNGTILGGLIGLFLGILNMVFILKA